MISENVLNPPEHWRSIFDIYTTDPTKFDAPVTAAKFNISEGEVSDILARMGRHMKRMDIVKIKEQQMEEKVKEYEKIGVDTTFNETGSDLYFDPKKVPEETPFKRHSEFKVMFGDDGEKEARETLRKRIASETRGRIEALRRYRSPLHVLLDERIGDDAMFSSEKQPVATSDGAGAIPSDAPITATTTIKDTDNSSPTKPMHTPKSTTSTQPSFNRWKFAFLDLSAPSSGNGDSSNSAAELKAGRRHRRQRGTKGGTRDLDTNTLIVTRGGRYGRFVD